MGEEEEEQEEITGMLKKLGDDEDPSTLLDQVERLSVEVQIKQAILGRSLSEPARSRMLPGPIPPGPQVFLREDGPGRRRRRMLGLDKVFKYLFKPIIMSSKNSTWQPKRNGHGNNGDKTTASVTVSNNTKGPKKYWKAAFSRSLRL